MVALEEVLDAEFPVAGVVVRLGPRVEAERADVETAVGEELGQVAEIVGEGLGLAIRVHEHERAPGVDGDRDEPERRGVEAWLALRARSAPQRAVEAVRPGVVGALDRLPPRVALAEDVAAVAADVDESTKLAVPRARQHDGERPRIHGRQLPRLCDLVETRRVLPGPRKDELLLEPQHRRVGVPFVRQRAGSGDGRHRLNLSPDDGLPAEARFSGRVIAERCKVSLT